MTRLGPERVGPFLRQQREQLTRIWRLARVSARSDAGPALLDGVVEDFYTLAGELLGQGAPPERAWTSLSGVLRWPGPAGLADLAEEWTLVAATLSATCESVNAAPEVATWLEQAMAACQAGTAALAGGGPRPPAVVVVRLFPRTAAQPQPARGGEPG